MITSKFQHLIDLSDSDLTTVDKLLSIAKEIKNRGYRYENLFPDKIMATLFYEPSTRTQLSFQAAMQRLGGQFIGFSDPKSSSANKGESLKDTIKMASSYSDIIVLRHPNAGAANVAAMYADCPVINAGDGSHLHPTQTLTDLFTLKEYRRLDNITIGVCGDLQNGRTTHSLCKALANYGGNKFVFISAQGLEMPLDICQELDKKGCKYTAAESLSDAISELDVLYMTRIQRERGSDPSNIHILDKKTLALASKDLAILHPLPRNNEIAVEIDDDPRALYYKQARRGVEIRMALIGSLIDSSFCNAPVIKGEISEFPCQNPNCITSIETYLPRYTFQNKCAYCEQDINSYQILLKF